MVAASLIGGAAPASAHANLLFASPAFDSTVTAAPKAITLLFDEPVTIHALPVTVTGPQGTVEVGTAVLTHDGSAVEVPVERSAGHGIYTVVWQVTADDGDIIGGSYRFAVGPTAASLSGGQATDAPGAWQTGILRGILFAALSLALGERAGKWLLRRMTTAPPHPRAWLPWTALLGLTASLGLALLLLGNGTFTGVLTHPEFSALVSSWPGVLAVGGAISFALGAAAALAHHPEWSWPPLVVVIVLEALRAHPGIANPLIGVPLTVFHLGAAALWVGTLVYILRTAFAWRHEAGLARAAIGAYARPAIWIVVAVTATGLGAALLLVPLDEVTTTDYGRVLLIKIALVIVAASLALAARRHLRRNAAPGRIRRPARLEAVVLVGILALSATLTLVPPPASADASLAFPPPASGPVVPAAALAGEVQVNAQASAGQLVVHMDAPEITDRAGQTLTTTFTLSGALATPSGATRQISFRSCGVGCFFTPVNWKEGSSQLTLSPTASGSHAEKAGLTIAWPPTEAGSLLSEAIAATTAAPAVVLHERVTSDTRRGMGTLMTFPMSGADFIRRSFFASGKVPAIVRLPDVDGNRRIAISYPAENAIDELTLSPNGTILRETITAPNHLITRTLIYPHALADAG
ncbi:hypothetical protein GCM10027052_08970 [Parafrigoribacterium mesophilum]